AITTTVSGADARVHVAGELLNTGAARGEARLTSVEVAAPGGALHAAHATTSAPVSLAPGRHAPVRAVFKIHAAKLWSPEHPSLFATRWTGSGSSTGTRCPSGVFAAPSWPPSRAPASTCCGA